MTRISGLLILLCAYVLLVPGLTKPMLSVTGTVEKQKLVDLGREILQEGSDKSSLLGGLAEMLIDQLEVDGTVTAFDKTRSIIGTAQELQLNGHLAVAILIVTFSVVIPTIKALLIIGSQLPLSQTAKRWLRKIGDAMSKWSMADVFVIGIFIAYLAAGGLQQSGGLVDFESELGEGFYYFLAYCLLSILGSQLLSYSATSKPEITQQSFSSVNQESLKEQVEGDSLKR